MKKLLPNIILSLAALCSSLFLLSQTTTPYHINGRAFQENCNCYTLTPDQFFVSGSVWNINKIDLRQSFDYTFNVFLGCTDGNGADGIAFVLQPISTSIGSAGEGIGFQGISPSIGVLIDTWQNGNNDDPVYDHISIHRNGDLNHTSGNSLSSTMRALENSDNIEDCQWHTLRVQWDATNKILKTQVDGKDRVQASIDLVNQVFSGDPQVFWGFTSATGGGKNHQRFCTALNPSFNLPPGLLTCFPTPIPFVDSSTSFGSIVKWIWDFGDGVKDSTNKNPVHSYSQPGIYHVKLNIVGNDGCLSDTFRKDILVGSKPVAAFKSTPEIACENSPMGFIDSSYVQYGTVNNWYWNINGDERSNQSPAIISLKDDGILPVRLAVKTREGCLSDTLIKTVNVLPAPETDFTYNDICSKQVATFQAENKTPGLPIDNYYWTFGDGKNDSSQLISHVFRRPGTYAVELSARSANGCISTPVLKAIKVYETRAFAGRDTIVSQNEPFQLHGTGGIFYSWSPYDQLNDPGIADPVATLQKNATYILTAYTPVGCATTDSIQIKVYKGPEFYIPNAFTPNNDGKNDRFRFIAVGMRKIDFFQIYNRFGQLVYSSTDTQTGWDGTLGGKLQATGTYVWMIKGLDAKGLVHFKKGTVTLVR